MNRNTPPNFADYERGPDFDRARSQIATPFQYFDIDLSSDGLNVVYPLSGDFIYVDASSTGVATLELNNQYNDPAAPFQIQANFAINAIFKQVKLSWSAQPGKKIRLMYSTGERVIPSNSGIQNVVVSGVTSVNVESDNSYMNINQQWKSTTPNAANTAVQIFDPAANLNGIIVHDVTAWALLSGYGKDGLFTGTVAPTLFSDGIILAQSLQLSSSNYNNTVLHRPKKIPAGYGLWWFSTTVNTYFSGVVDYQVL